MSVFVENFRKPLIGDWDPAGGWGYQVRTPVNGPIAIEGLQDAILRYLDGALERCDSDCVVVCRDDLIDTEPVWRQFVKAHVAAKGHKFAHEVVWVVGDRTAVRISFVPLPRGVETPTYLGQQDRQPLPQSIAEGLRFESPVRTGGAWNWSSMRPSSPRSPVYEES
jgi:hypothetical protein